MLIVKCWCVPHKSGTLDFFIHERHAGEKLEGNLSITLINWATWHCKTFLKPSAKQRKFQSDHLSTFFNLRIHLLTTNNSVPCDGNHSRFLKERQNCPISTLSCKRSKRETSKSKDIFGSVDFFYRLKLMRHGCLSRVSSAFILSPFPISSIHMN